MLTLITAQRFLRHRQWKTDFQCLRTEALKANGKQLETRSDLEEVVKKKACKLACLQAFFGGELGIRTLGTLRTQHFECCTFDLSDNSPYIVFEIRQHVFQAYLFHNGYSIKKPCGCQ